MFCLSTARPKAELTDAEGKVLMRNPVHERGKMARADPVASCLERGYQRRGECPDTGGPWWGLDQGKSASERDGIRLFAGPWTQAYLDEVESFPEADLCDCVDATSGAWAWLEAHSFGHQLPAIYGSRRTDLCANPHDIHPEDRPDPLEEGKDRGGRWVP